MSDGDRAARAAAEWRREMPDLDVGGMALIGRLTEAAQLAATHHAAPFLARFGLKAGEFDVIATLRRAGAPYALTPTELYAATMLSSGGMTNRLDRLEALGLIERRPHPTDRRGTLVSLTPRGVALIEEAIVDHAANKTRVANVLSAGEQQQLSALLAKLIVGIDPDSPGYVGGPPQPETPGGDVKPAPQRRK